MRLRIRLIVLLFILSVATFTTGIKGDEGIELDSCTDRCDRNYIACCQQAGGGNCPKKCGDEQITCYGKCN